MAVSRRPGRRPSRPPLQAGHTDSPPYGKAFTNTPPCSHPKGPTGRSKLAQGAAERSPGNLSSPCLLGLKARNIHYPHRVGIPGLRPLILNGEHVTQALPFGAAWAVVLWPVGPEIGMAWQAISPRVLLQVSQLGAPFCGRLPTARPQACLPHYKPAAKSVLHFQHLALARQPAFRGALHWSGIPGTPPPTGTLCRSTPLQARPMVNQKGPTQSSSRGYTRPSALDFECVIRNPGLTLRARPTNTPGCGFLGASGLLVQVVLLLVQFHYAKRLLTVFGKE